MRYERFVWERGAERRTKVTMGSPTGDPDVEGVAPGLGELWFKTLTEVCDLDLTVIDIDEDEDALEEDRAVPVGGKESVDGDPSDHSHSDVSAEEETSD